MLTIRKATFSVAMLVAVVAVALIGASSASAASVAYLDGHEVWVATTDGSARARLSSGEGDWTAVAQSDQGYIVGVRLEAGKISQLSSFTVWNPVGALIHFGPLAGNSNGSLAYPLSLDITPDGGLLVYGYSQYIYGFPTSTLIQGHYLLPSATTAAPVPEPYRNTSERWPTLVGERIVATPDQQQVDVQDPGSIAGTAFTPWADFSGVSGFDLHRVDVSATGTVMAAELDQFGPPEIMKIAVIPTSGLGGSLLPGDCFLPADALPRFPSLSQDGTLIAWSDTGGVKVAGVPNFSGADPCSLTQAPVTISATGSYPSVGPFNVAALIQTQTPPAPTPPTVTAPSSAKLKDLLKGGISIKVSSVTGGKASLKLTVKPKLVGKKGKKAIVIGTASGSVAPGGVVKTIKLKLNKKGKSLKKKLKGKKATLTVTIAGTTTTKSIKLK